jgi:hypothetical protein
VFVNIELVSVRCKKVKYVVNFHEEPHREYISVSAVLASALDGG